MHPAFVLDVVPPESIPERIVGKVILPLAIAVAARRIDRLIPGVGELPFRVVLVMVAPPVFHSVQMSNV